MDILKRITELRQERNWSVYKLAEEAGLTQSTLANMFSRKTLPSFSTLQQICSAFNISLSEFFSDSKELNNEELELLGNFRELNSKNKKMVLEIVRTIKTNN